MLWPIVHIFRYLLASKLEYRETMIKMILCIWIRFVRQLRH